MIKKVLWMTFMLLSIVVADDKKNIFILHSYSQEYSWTKLQHNSFINRLDKLNILGEIETEYLDTKRVPFLTQYQEHFLGYLKEKYNNYNPDIIYCSDDNALQFMRTYKSQLFPNIPVVFSGINNLALQKELDSEQYTGVFELKEIKPNIELIRQFSPQTRDLFFVGDDSNTYKAIEQLIKKELPNFPKYNFHFFASNAIDAVVLSIKNQLHPKPFIILTTIGGFINEAGSNLTLQSSIEALSKIENSVLLTMEDAYMLPGVVGGYVTSGNKQGALAAEMAQQILQGTSIKNITPVVEGSNIYMFDKKELQKSRLVLSEYIARNAILKNERIPFIEKYQNVILNALFLLSMVMIIFFVFFYLIYKERLSKYNQLQLKFNEHTQRLENTILSIDMLEHVFILGYWYKDLMTDEFFFSKGISTLCGTDENIAFNSLDEFLQYVDIADRDLVKNNILRAIESVHPIEFYHKIHSNGTADITVFHKIDFHRDNNFNVKKVVGMIRLIDTCNT